MECVGAQSGVSNWVFACVDFGLVTCFQGNRGKIEYSERLPGGAQGYTASPVSDGRHLYFAGESGRVLVVPVSNHFLRRHQLLG
jgi:hypothetical protein